MSELSEVYYEKYKLLAGKSVLSRELQRLKLRYKKLSVRSAEKSSYDVQKKEEYMIKISDVPIKDLIFIDESGANLQMAPRYGRAYKVKEPPLQSLINGVIKSQ